MKRNGGDVYIDFGKGWDTEHYVEYEGARASRVLADIDRYYSEGIKPQGTVMFREQAEAYERQLSDIKEKAIADGSFMKAPNGKPTNLTERQWLQVRTPQFKEWFGDWELANKQKVEKIKRPYENSSKVVDENGEPLEVDGLFINDDGEFIKKINEKLEEANKFANKIRKYKGKYGIDLLNSSGVEIERFINSLSEDKYEEWARLILALGDTDDRSREKLVSDILKGVEPEIVVGFRYGNVKEEGASYNYRDNVFEAGVSIVGRVRELNTDRDGYYEAFFGKQPYNIVAGLYTGRHGADGEMVLSAAQLLSDAKNAGIKVKSAADNIGSFDAQTDDIRFRDVYGGNSGYIGYSMSRRA